MFGLPWTKLRPRNVLLLHDNALSPTASFTVEHINSFRWQLLSHRQYSPDLAPCNFFLFPKLKKRLAGNKYETRVALVSAVNRYLNCRFTSWFAKGIQKLLQRWQKCTDIGSEYFEKDFLKNI